MNIKEIAKEIKALQNTLAKLIVKLEKLHHKLIREKSITEKEKLFNQINSVKKELEDTSNKIEIFEKELDSLVEK